LGSCSPVAVSSPSLLLLLLLLLPARDSAFRDVSVGENIISDLFLIVMSHSRLLYLTSSCRENVKS